MPDERERHPKYQPAATPTDRDRTQQRGHVSRSLRSRGCAAVMAAWAAVSKLVSSNGTSDLEPVVVGDRRVAESVDQWSGDAGLDWGDEP